MVRRGDKTNIGGTSEVFQATRWTDIRKLGSQNDGLRQQIIDGLIRRYWKPVYCYLRHKGQTNEAAKDLTQGFFQEVVLGGNLLQQADQAKGRFRTFLLTALDRYVSNVYRKETAQKRSPAKGIIPLDDGDIVSIAMLDQEAGPEQIFHYAWASGILDAVLSKTREECYSSGKGTHWEVFDSRALSPIMNDTTPLPLPEICRKFGIDSQQKASNMIVTVKRTFRTILERHLRQSVRSDSEVCDELTELLVALSRTSAR